MLLQWLVISSLAAAVVPAEALPAALPSAAGTVQGSGRTTDGAARVEGNSYFYFVRGRQLESDGQIDAAVQAFQQAARLDPRAAEIPAELAALYARQNRAPEAIEWAERALALNKENPEANRVLGLIHASLAHLDDDTRPDAAATASANKAIGYLETARHHSVSPEPALEMMLARLYLRVGKTDPAIAVLKRLTETEPDRSEPYALLAEAYREANRPADATKLLEGAVAEHPEFYAMLGRIYERDERWDDAVKAYERALIGNPRNSDVKTRLAVVLLSEGGVEKAERAASLLKDVRQQDPTDIQTVYLLTQAQRVAGNLDEAETTARQLVALAPTLLTGSYALAQVLEQKQEYRQVVETLEPIASKVAAGGETEQLSPLLVSLGFAHEELGEWDKALAAFARARTIKPPNPSLDIYQLGVLVMARRDKEALARVPAALSAHPGDQRVIRLQAEVLGRTGRRDEAVRLLHKACEEHPGDVTSYLALSEFHAGAEEYAAALKVLEGAAARFPSDASIRFSIGSVYEREKRYADAERAFREALSKDPQYAPALNYLGYMLADRGERLDESVGYIKRALQVEPYNGAYRDSLGWAYFKQDKLDLAEETLKKAADQRVRDSAVQDHLGDVYYRLGRYEDAVAAWRRALAGDGESVDRKEIDRKIRSAIEKVTRR